MKIIEKLQMGGVPKEVTFTSAPSLNRHKGYGDETRVTETGKQIDDARKWQTDWYAKRKATNQFDDQLDDNTMQFINDRTANSNIRVVDGNNYNQRGANGVTRISDNVSNITVNADPTYQREAKSYGLTFEDSLTHELAHGATMKSSTLSAPTQEEYDRKSKDMVIPSVNKINDIIGGGVFMGGNNNYEGSAVEIQARLNTMRRAANLDPAKIDYNYKDLKPLLKKYGLDYGKEKSELLINTVAQNPTSSDTLYAQQGGTLQSDNTRVNKPSIHTPIKVKPIKVKPSQLIDLGGEPSKDNRTSAQRNKDYWHPIKGVKDRFKSSMKNETNPLVGLERTVLPAAAGAGLVTTPATVIGGIIGSELVNKATGGWGEWLENKTGLPSELGEYTNPGGIYGGLKGYKIDSNKLASKFIKGDADLGWSPLINTKRFKYHKDIPIQSQNSYRVVGKGAIDDAKSSGVIRQRNAGTSQAEADAVQARIAAGEKVPLLDKLAIGSRSGNVPYFTRGSIYMPPTKNQAVIVGTPKTQFRRIGPKGKINQFLPDEPINIKNSITPHSDGKFVNAPAKDFSYYDHGTFGWREKSFDGNNGLINKNHWMFNKESRTPTNIAMATANRVMPFLSNIEKTPARIAAYKVGRRTQGNASVSLKDIKRNESTYTGAATPEGSNGRDLLGMYLFKNDPIISKSPWFQKIAKSFEPAKGSSFKYGERYSELYPGIENRRYRMQSVVKHSHPLKFKNINEFNEYSSGIGKLQGKEGDMVIETSKGFQTFRQPGTNYAGPIDDIGGHAIKIDYNNKGRLTQISQDMWKFNPADYSKRWSGKSTSEAIRSNKQAALMDKVGTPFILQQENPIVIGTRRVWNDIKNMPQSTLSRRQPFMQGDLLTLKVGGRFTFKENSLTKNAKSLNGKRDMRKKFVKSDRVTYNRVRKGFDGLKFVEYESMNRPLYNMSNTFEEYKYPTYQRDITIPDNEIKVDTEVENTKPEDIKPVDTKPVDTKPEATAKSSRFTGKKDFTDKMRSAFVSALSKKGIDPKYANYLVAQSALESGWGRSQSGKFNFGGIKGKGTMRNTREVINGKDVMLNESFRDFNSVEDYADYHVGLLNNNRYKAFSGEDFIDQVVKGGYATDPRYKDSLNKMYQQITKS